MLNIIGVVVSRSLSVDVFGQKFELRVVSALGVAFTLGCAFTFGGAFTLGVAFTLGGTFTLGGAFTLGVRACVRPPS
jgi:hypothetical protein